MKHSYLEDQLKLALKNLKDIEFALNEASIVAITDHHGNINYVNKKFCVLSQYSHAELIGQNHRIINSGYHSRDFFNSMWKTISNGRTWHGEIKNKAKDGSYYWVDTTIVPFLDDDGKPYQYISIRNEITSRKEFEEEIKFLAYYDSLTKLPNRNLMEKHFHTIVSYKEREKPLALLFIDLDRFKKINDTFGHSIGDRLLEKVAERLQHIFGDTAFVSRLGGDEFILLFDQIDQKTVIKLANKVLVKMIEPFELNKHKIIVTTSIGISFATPDDIRNYSSTAEFIETLIQQADIAMYHAKQQGGNRAQFNNPTINAAVKRTFNLENELQHALENEEFFIHYQPIVDLQNKDIVELEALLRWENSKYGYISPDEFIPILEETGLIRKVGKWILKTVSEQINSWHKQDIHLSKVAVNISPIQFNDENFIRDLHEILQETQLNPKYLNFEITENVLYDFNKSLDILYKLHNLHINISIDDFGTGYSSLSYLKFLPIDTIKIDKSFIDNLDEDGKMIVQSIITMGKNLHYTLIAEGIETEKQLEFLKMLGCERGQGYLFSTPLSTDAVTRLLGRNSVTKHLL
ncbi:EAL domain-containing protein [Metabacillus litoralis]|uniref:EAL domain-containing protein n=1 Tax=Metabacillus litoralis TaxID=152268 RepID=A0A5C6VWH3_9BACI|nr:EAL domain-containing protein [Metabacillus litoralis]TXC89330.1 EAL domain-containing protein [Metabacillus litoralis]